MDAFDGVTPVLDLDYTYDLAGNITDIDDIGGGSRIRVRLALLHYWRA